MQVTERARGPRERRKIKTRKTIRREAFRLIEENGYAATTVEKIAEAAEVSPSTFFRYFPSKDSLLLADDLESLVEAFKAQPPELSPGQAIRRAYVTTITGLSPEQLELENTRQRLIFSMPELKAIMYDEHIRAIAVMAEALGQRICRAGGDFEVQVYVGAMVGAMMAAYDNAQRTVESIYRALDFLDAGMPLG